MSKRFSNFSKYRNANLSAAKREEWYMLPPNHVNLSGDSVPFHASQDLLAFRSGLRGSAVAIVPIANAGRIPAGTPVIEGASGAITDLQFSPWTSEGHDLLAAGGENGCVKIWKIPSAGLDETISSPLATLPTLDKRIESLAYNPAADGILAASAGNQIAVYDVTKASVSFTLDSADLVQSISWKSNGALLASTSRDKQLNIYDPRGSGASPVQTAPCHTGIKAAKVVWIGNSDLVFTTGFSQRREREYALWDTRNLSKPLTLTSLDTSPGLITPLYDADTGMLFLAGKGDTSIRWVEVKADDASSPISPGAVTFNSSTVLAGATLLPKLAVNVMECEVDRIFSIASDGSAIIPISVTVPRKSHIDFHADLFPDTPSNIASLGAEQWLSGVTELPALTSLDPQKRMRQKTVSPGEPSAAAASAPAPIATGSTTTESAAQPISVGNSQYAVSSESAAVKPQPKFLIPKQSSYRFVSGKTQQSYDDLRGLSVNLPNESSGLEANSKYLAFLLAGSGGRVAVWPRAATGRLPVKIPCTVSGADIKDFKFNPFDDSCLVTATDEGRVHIWKIPDGGLADDIDAAEFTFVAHSSRPSVIQFHPTVSNLLLTASTQIRLWDLRTRAQLLDIPHPDMVLACSFRLDGNQVVTTCRDGQIRIFDARTGALLQEGPSHEGVKASRVLWMGKSDQLVSVGFGKASQREINVYASDDLKKPLHSVVVDTSPSVLMPFYDEDTSLLYLSGRGESSTLIYELSSSGPTPVSRFDTTGIQQGFSFLPKTTCDVRTVEIAHGYRLTQTAIESFSFTVPRLKKEFFQDDIFVPTRDVETACLDVDNWKAGENVDLKYVDLKPADMQALSNAPVEVTKVLVTTGTTRFDELVKSMVQRAQDEGEDEELPQDKVEGVDDDEWVSAPAIRQRRCPINPRRM
ncbi:hypothetical protein BC832DRAFT_528471 [Gaertneriomyces semiglobifer]|nr:hypothetical protein BC832DRAFT_528471 [Gaertneriomyces semiglobifer]